MEAIESVFQQEYGQIEIVIGDDSPDDESQTLVNRLACPPHINIFYEKNLVGLGQSANVNRLFERANGSHITLLHDDDTLLPHALSILARPWEERDDLALSFGKQEVISADGAIMTDRTIEMNASYLRTPDRAGFQVSPLTSAFLQQIPNNGYLVDARIAKGVGYGIASAVGVYCDIDFNIRLTRELKPGQICFVDAFVSQYRLSQDAISSKEDSLRSDHATAGLEIYKQVLAIAPTPKTQDARTVLLRRQSDKALKALALAGMPFEALRVFFSRFYPLSRRLSRKGFYHLALIIFPKIDNLRSYRNRAR